MTSPLRWLPAPPLPEARTHWRLLAAPLAGGVGAVRLGGWVPRVGGEVVQVPSAHSAAPVAGPPGRAPVPLSRLPGGRPCPAAGFSSPEAGRGRCAARLGVSSRQEGRALPPPQAERGPLFPRSAGGCPQAPAPARALAGPARSGGRERCAPARRQSASAPVPAPPPLAVAPRGQTPARWGWANALQSGLRAWAVVCAPLGARVLTSARGPPRRALPEPQGPRATPQRHLLPVPGKADRCGPRITPSQALNVSSSHRSGALQAGRKRPSGLQVLCPLQPEAPHLACLQPLLPTTSTCSEPPHPWLL